ncbi:MAG: tRNA uridine-5-carboxymethylaminomethyl(34) synthesis enzyme MnmG [Firmicutes bacterium]|nr:tRNA uridine-5-carboxymethylaminomethyl(34) synthesis enzyme MnmG [Bacillota bacterium]
MKTQYDVIVIGSGHAGVESAHASAKLGCSTLLLTINLDNISYMACNPSIGGSAKGHLVCEIDALGGLMGTMADSAALQIRVLNTGKGAAVHALRAQTDKVKYHLNAKKILEDLSNLVLRQGEVESIIKDNDFHIQLTTGEKFTSQSVVIATGTYLNSTILIGEKRFDAGPSGFARSNYLSKSLQDLGIKMQRFDTGTTARLDGLTIDLSKTTTQHGDENIQTFSAMTKRPIKNIITCALTYTNPETHKIIMDNLHRSHEFFKMDKTASPRYCPSIETKVHRFPDRERHQTFLEPESMHTNEYYMQGVTTSLPIDVQEQFIRTIPGLENVAITRPGYGIEYDCIDPMQLDHKLECKTIAGLFFAGQVNGTSGYEEAAAQGIIAGINAAHKSLAKDEFTLSRTNSYIGVLVDDLVTQGTPEPYRMLTSRAEHRLHLRQDNADIRLTQLGRGIGLVCNKRYNIFKKKLDQIKLVQQSLSQPVQMSDIKRIFEKYDESTPQARLSLEQCIRRGNITLNIMAQELNILTDIPPSVLDYVTIETKYSGYLEKEQARIKETLRCESTKIPSDIDYNAIKALSGEGLEKLIKHKPATIAAANKISGVTPADINVLLVWLRKNNT